MDLIMDLSGTFLSVDSREGHLNKNKRKDSTARNARTTSSQVWSLMVWGGDMTRRAVHLTNTINAGGEPSGRNC